MTNAEIITGIKALHGIDFDEELCTFGVWKNNGYKVKKGEHGITTRLWKYNKKKDIKLDEDATEEEQKQARRGFYLAKATLFRASQVEKMEVANG